MKKITVTLKDDDAWAVMSYIANQRFDIAGLAIDAGEPEPPHVQPSVQPPVIRLERPPPAPERKKKKRGGAQQMPPVLLDEEKAEAIIRDFASGVPRFKTSDLAALGRRLGVSGSRLIDTARRMANAGKFHREGHPRGGGYIYVVGEHLLQGRG